MFSDVAVSQRYLVLPRFFAERPGAFFWPLPRVGDFVAAPRERDDSVELGVLFFVAFLAVLAGLAGLAVRAA